MKKISLLKDIMDLFGKKDSSKKKEEKTKVEITPSDENDELLNAINSKRKENTVLDKSEDAILSSELPFDDLDYLDSSDSTEELIDEDDSITDLPTDFDELASFGASKDIHTESIDEGLVLSLANLGKVDIEYISAITGTDPKSVISYLSGSIFQNPEKWDKSLYKGWETADEYLSGNLLHKLRIARKANEEFNGYFSDNVEALKKELPPSIEAEDIYVTLGSPWLPTTVVDQFITYLLGDVIPNVSDSASAVKHDSETGIWEIPNKSRYSYTKYVGRSIRMYGTIRMEALHIIEKTLNQKTIAVYDEVPSPHKIGKTVRRLNQDETVLAIEKQELILSEFKSWIWSDPQRKEQLVRVYEEKYSTNKIRHFDGSFLTFPGLNPSISLYPYQKNAVARILFTPNTLLAHDVGSGKTYIMIAAGMELKRTGISKKNVYVVPNNLVGQWKDIFLSMYKNARLLVIEPKSFTPAKRQATLKRMRDEEFDGIIMAYSSFNLIPMSYDHKTQRIEEEIEKYKKANKNLSSDRFSKQRQRLEKELFESHLKRRQAGEIFFDDLGINTIFLDEAHNFKNVPIDTQIDRVLGIGAGGSAKCQDMLDKIYYVQRTNNGRGAVLATGTPITNSVTDAYVMQKYLQNGDLKMLGLASFDGWVGMFAEKSTEFEIDIDTGSYRLATRFSKFHNLPELTSLFASVADFHIADKSVGVPDFNGYIDTITKRDPLFKDYLKVISKRADDVRKGKVKRNEDNLLLITTDGRKAALDMRLIDSKLQLGKGYKAEKCADNVYSVYKEYNDILGTQLIFCDYSTPKQGFNLYDELKCLLIARGIPSNEIEFIHNANTEKLREKLFKSVREGKIRVLIGSTFKLGLGVNVQDRLIAVHHLDVPWRPADMTQREGRILRQGNTNDEVFIYRYITKGSFDAYSWQLLETKQRFISSLLSGHLQERDGSDVCDTVLNYAEIKAIAVGNPVIKERVEVANELDKLIILKRERIKQLESMAQEQLSIPTKISNQERLLCRAKVDSDFTKTEAALGTPEERKELREVIDIVIKANVMQTAETELFEYRGFKILLPAGMKEDSPYVWLERRGKYFVELGSSSLGYFVRIDNFIDNLDRHYAKLTDEYEKLLARQDFIEDALKEADPYSDKIDELTEKLKELDEKLGVKKK